MGGSKSILAVYPEGCRTERRMPTALCPQDKQPRVAACESKPTGSPKLWGATHPQGFHRQAKGVLSPQGGPLRALHSPTLASALWNDGRRHGVGENTVRNNQSRAHQSGDQGMKLSSLSFTCSQDQR